MSGRPTISAIVVSYNTRAMTLDCLAALKADLAGIASEIIVVDNASTDGSAAAVGESFPDVTVIASAENLGFGRANNRGMAAAAGEVYLLINSDAFAQPGAAAALLEAVETRPDVAVVGPKLLNSDGSVQQSCFRFPTPGQAWRENLWLSTIANRLGRPAAWVDLRGWAHDAPRDVDFLSGACLLVRRAAVEQIGGFDEDFFMYAEETDWQRRMRDEGWRIAFVPAAVVTHLGGGSGAGERARINRHFFDSLDHYERKHHGRLGLISLRLAMAAGGAARAAAWSAIYLLRPRRREAAAAKIGLHAWLLRRQLFHWPASTAPTAPSGRSG